MNSNSANDPKTPHRCPWWMQYLLVCPLRKLIEPADKLLKPYVKQGMVVAEPGCGFGYMSLALARLVGAQGKVISVDVEERAIARLQKRAQKAGLAERLEARVCSARHLGLAEHEGQIDLLALVHVLHELEDLPGFLTQAQALLKPSGRMLVVEPKGHVSPERFGDQLQSCQQTGFQVLEQSSPGDKRLLALLAPISN